MEILVENSKNAVNQVQKGEEACTEKGGNKLEAVIISNNSKKFYCQANGRNKVAVAGGSMIIMLFF